MSKKIDVESLKNYLENECGLYGGELEVKKFGAGQSNPTYHLKLGSQELVLRKKPDGKLLRGAHQVGREYRAMKALHGVGFPVPKVLAHCTDDNVIGTEFFLMEFMRGNVSTYSLPSESAKDNRHYLLSAVETLAKLHSISPGSVGLADYGKKNGFCQRQVNTWWRQYDAAKHKVIPEMNDLAHWLKSNIPADVAEPSIVHGDFSIGNIMFHPTENKVLCVLDWELSTLGDPLADIAYFCMPYYLPQELLQASYRIDLNEIISEEEIVRHYCRARGISYPLPNFEFYKALACFRLASILQGVYRRFLRGNSSQDSAKFVETTIQPMASAGLKVALSAGSGNMKPMTLSPSEKGQASLEKVNAFIKKHVAPSEKEYYDFYKIEGNRWKICPIVEDLKAKAKTEGLWNLFLPEISGLSNVDYAHVAEQLGKYHFAPEVFNCSAPDTGNIEVLYRYGDEYQKQKWLTPLLEGKIRSAFCMTEPAVASSDATNMQLSMTPDGESYIVNGRKWWSSGAGDPRCKFGIVMGRATSPDNRGPHQAHSMVIVPFDTPGVTLVRPLSAFGFFDHPYGRMEIEFDNVRVPKRNLIGGEGRGFEIAQARLGPARVHHCMRSLGIAERCVEYFLSRSWQRKAFGKRLIDHQVNQHHLAETRIEIEQARLLVLKTAFLIDENGGKAARKLISMMKVAALRAFKNAVDKTIQIHGAAGVSQDFPFASWFASARALQIADGPDEVHLSLIARMEISEQARKSRL